MGTLGSLCVLGLGVVLFASCGGLAGAARVDASPDDAPRDGLRSNDGTAADSSPVDSGAGAADSVAPSDTGAGFVDSVAATDTRPGTADSGPPVDGGEHGDGSTDAPLDIGSSVDALPDGPACPSKTTYRCSPLGILCAPNEVCVTYRRVWGGMAFTPYNCVPLPASCGCSWSCACACSICGAGACSGASGYDCHERSPTELLCDQP